jgi:protein-tyrosine phosphatase
VRVELDFAYGGGKLFAGPYREWVNIQRNLTDLNTLFRVKLAEEITGESDMVVPVRDFGVPPEGPFKAALYEAGVRLMDGKDVFAGCGFGIGRTGTYIAALCKLHREVVYILRRSRQGGDDVETDPVEEARDLYRSTAVETEDQELFVRELDLSRVARALAFRKKRLVVLDKRFWGF